MGISNQEFLSVLFKDDLPFVHVTDFTYDPSNIPPSKVLRSWRGDWFSRYEFSKGATNQYFTVSVFNPDDKGVPRRRKSLFLRTRVVVLDDVKEKLALDQASRLPKPTYIMETSQGSEQWGYVLTTPETSQDRIDNLHDGLVASELAPGGEDPGQKGTTRYVRLPDGHNTKKSKLVNGQPFKCRITSWNPFHTVTLEQLAEPFGVNLNVARAHKKTEGASNIPDSPLIKIPEIIQIKSMMSDGRFDITCPWVDEHTEESDSGTAMFTNDDGSLGFKCHHGHCQGRTGKHLMQYIEARRPGFSAEYKNWRVIRDFNKVVPISFLGHPRDTPGTPQVSFMGEPVTDPHPGGIWEQVEQLSMKEPGSEEQKNAAVTILRLVDDLPEIDRGEVHEEVCDVMGWTKTRFKTIIADLRDTWYTSGISKDKIAFMDTMAYVQEQDRILDTKTWIWYTTQAFQNSFCSVDPDIKKKALQESMMKNVQKVEFSPGKDQFFTAGGVKYVNLWDNEGLNHGIPGDCTPWLRHFDHMGISQHRDHILKWMAFTIQHPERKINHMLILGGGEGIGKDFILSPVEDALGEKNCTTIHGEDLLDKFNEYLMGAKLVKINEVELSDMREASSVGAKLKPLAAAPPFTLKVNQKTIARVEIPNICNIAMMTNNRLPFQIKDISRRMYAVWSDLRIRDSNGDVAPGWKEYWTSLWDWYNHRGGKEACIHYLRNHIDVSDFEPGASPPVTDFLRDIHDMSKPALQNLLEQLINDGFGAFKSDIVMLKDVIQTIKAAVFDTTYGAGDDVDLTRMKSTYVRRTLEAMEGVMTRRARNEKNDSKTTVFVVRHHLLYVEYSERKLFKTCIDNLKKIKMAPPPKVRSVS